MKSLPPRTRWLIWFALLVLWLAVWAYPLSDPFTRTASAVLLGVVWFQSPMQIMRWQLLDSFEKH